MYSSSLNNYSDYLKKNSEGIVAGEWLDIASMFLPKKIIRCYVKYEWDIRHLAIVFGLGQARLGKAKLGQDSAK